MYTVYLFYIYCFLIICCIIRIMPHVLLQEAVYVQRDIRETGPEEMPSLGL